MHFMYVLLMTCQHERRWSMRDVKAFRNHEKYAALWPRKQSSSCIKLWLHHNRADGSNPFLQNLFTQKRKCFKGEKTFILILEYKNQNILEIFICGNLIV